MQRFLPFALVLGGALTVLLPSELCAQDPQGQRPLPAGRDTTELVFEREVFVYPSYQRRDPFTPLLGEGESGPRFEEVRLVGIVFSTDPDRSVATLGPKSGSGGGEQAGRYYRVRRGDTLGRMRILEIQERRVVLEVEEFGMTEQHILELPRPGQGDQS